MDAPPLSIPKLGPGSLPMFLQFFDGDDFSDNPQIGEADEHYRSDAQDRDSEIRNLRVPYKQLERT